MQNLSSTGKTFKTGAAVAIDFDVANTGEEVLDGIAYLTIQGPSGYSQTMSQNLNLLNPGGVQHIHLDWDSNGVPDGIFTVNTYVRFASRISAMQSLELANIQTQFLPFVAR